MRTFAGIDEVKAAVGHELGVSDWHEITQEMIDAFADATGDHQWIHTDPERAADGPFGRTIAHGFLTLSMLSAFAFEIWSIDGVSMVMNYGSNKVRFTAPVPVGSRLRGRAVLVDVKETSGGYQVVTDYTIELESNDLEGGGRPAVFCQNIALIVP